ncbi:hypothetical protein AAMO2058_000048100 [Amorphochlora amoebiformis]
MEPSTALFCQFYLRSNSNMLRNNYISILRYANLSRFVEMSTPFIPPWSYLISTPPLELKLSESLLATTAVVSCVAIFLFSVGNGPKLSRALAKGRASCGNMDDGVIGDPSLTVTTNVVMDKSKKMGFMKAASKLVSSALGKPESYVAIAVNDGTDLIWGGEDVPAALCQVVSLGSINLENNKKVSEGVCEMLKDFGIAGTKVYIEFRDVARENMGYDGKTFAG